MASLEKWRSDVSPMLSRLQEDQAYRARWVEERGKRFARWQRRAAFIAAVAGAVAVLASAVVQLSHVF